MPRNVKFPDCCRARIFHSFGGHGTPAGYGHKRVLPMDVKDLDKWLRKQDEEYGGGAARFICVILNSKQNNLYKETFERNGFKCVGRTDYLSFYLKTRLEY